ncbi:hypothetical protein PRZ48_004452 [Zasmidium cellare]|uniref:Copper acquisition factor BIM1-like domain-containing protein n=1 Tax=Zasmidium cellare TaxID=395010 RepID=A0ABR0EPJ7_ZASCE|nr:hypothetical protein PRZ48_004452 [Zasmidium cellare]
MYSNAVLVGAVLLQGLVAANGGSYSSSEMGPAAFMWPEDRPWSADADNTAPCGSSSGVGARTEFPLSNGRLALVTQEDTRAVNVGVSYNSGEHRIDARPDAFVLTTLSDPQSLSDFDIFYRPEAVGDLGIGHTCIRAPDPPSNITAGTNATFMLFYQEGDSDSDEAFYACTDVTYIERQAFTTRIPCFNATQEEPEVDPDPLVGVITTNPDGSDPHPSESHRLSNGAIAGAIVGSVVGALAIAGLGFFLWRRSKKSKAARQPAMSKTKDVERVESGNSSN